MEGIKTVEQVDARIVSEERYNDDVKLVLTALGTKRASTMEERSMFIDWTVNLGFTLEAITHLAKITKAKKGNFLKVKYFIYITRGIKEILFILHFTQRFQSQVALFFVYFSYICITITINLLSNEESYSTIYNTTPICIGSYGAGADVVKHILQGYEYT